VAYPIHVVYINFSQPVAGFAWTDNNLFHDLYTGVLACFEFTFGAVVLVRPYITQDLYTYSMTYVMMMFSFFGNIMMANLLVAFLASQFDHISTNAKYLTMNMQFGLIKVYKCSDTVSLISMPFVLTPIALPFYCLMIKQGELRTKINNGLRWLIHIVNIFIPVIVYYTFRLLLIMPMLYALIGFDIIVGMMVYPSNLFYFMAWIFTGPILLTKLFFLDLKTMAGIIFYNPQEKLRLLDFELGDQARANLVNIFQKFNRVIQHELKRDPKPVLTVKEFKNILRIEDVKDELISKITMFTNVLARLALPAQGEESEHLSRVKTTEALEEKSKMDINSHYCQDLGVLIPELLVKYAKRDPRYPTQSDDNLTLNLKFMNDKFYNKINSENVDKLVSYEQGTLDKSREFLQFKEEDFTHGFKKVNGQISKVNTKVDTAKATVAEMKETMKELFGLAGIEFPSVIIPKY
jgi:hypothetical protein